ncbi:MAG: DUF2958 domain-containing protein [Cyanobacteria bacterium]|nr:DUF2958 domain-containing protein [Cyanobacteriota bacterium]
MKLITKAIAKKVPPLRGQENLSIESTLAYVKLFTPDSNWTWYITEMDPDTGECFGLVCGLERELGSFLLSELEAVRGPLGLPIERDRYFDPTTVNLCK